VGPKRADAQGELKRLDEQIAAVIDLAALKLLFSRLNEIVQAFPDDFDVQLAANEVKQRLLARGSQLKQQETAPGAPVRAAEPIGAQPQLMPRLPLSSAAGANPPARPLPVDRGARRQRPSTPGPAPGNRDREPFHWNGAVVMGLAGGLLALALIFLVVHESRKRTAVIAARFTPVQVEIATAPASASVSVTAEHPAPGGSEPAACRSDCKLALRPGAYRISASLDGYQPAEGAVIVKAGQPEAVRLTLQPQPESVRLFTDLAQGKMLVDDQPPVDLQGGHLELDKIAAGAHTVRVIGKDESASFSFTIADAQLPAVASTVTARNMIAVVVASFGKQARIATNAGPWKLAVNGQAQSDVGPAGTEVTGFQPGANEIVVGDGKDRRNMSETFPPAPALTVFLKTEPDTGTLIVSTGEDGASVFVNGKESRGLTQHGQLRIPALGKVSVRVAKGGFLDEPEQTAEVKKGEEVRLEFNLRPQPKFGSLEIRGALPGTTILVDQKAAGVVGQDGSFSVATISPGDHTIELRRDQSVPKRLERSFRAGQAVTLAAADTALTPTIGTVRLKRSPTVATITYRRGDEKEPHEARGNEIELAPGRYTFSATAPGFADSAIPVLLAAGEIHEVSFALARERTVPPPAGMAEFEDAGSWQKEGDAWVHKGGGFLAYRLPAKGVFTFTVQLVKGGNVFRAGQIRWCIQYVDSKNYLLYEMDRKVFWAGVVRRGERLERVKEAHNLGNQKAYTIQIEVTPEHAIQRVRVGGDWKVLDTFAEPGRDFTRGQFGFLIPGNDEIALSDFRFQPM